MGQEGGANFKRNLEGPKEQLVLSTIPTAATSHPKCDFIDQPLGTPVKATFPFYLSSHLFNDPSAKAPTRRRLYGWTTSFCTPQVQASGGLVMRPFQVDVAIDRGQSAVFDGVSGQLVQSDGDGLGGV